MLPVHLQCKIQNFQTLPGLFKVNKQETKTLALPG